MVQLTSFKKPKGLPCKLLKNPCKNTENGLLKLTFFLLRFSMLTKFLSGIKTFLWLILKTVSSKLTNTNQNKEISQPQIIVYFPPCSTLQFLSWLVYHIIYFAHTFLLWYDK